MASPCSAASRAHRDGLPVVLPDAVPEEVRLPEQSLPDGVSLHGGEPRPVDRLPVVLLNAIAEVVRRSEKSLCVGVSLLGENSSRLQVDSDFIAAGWHAGQQRDGNAQTDQ